MAMKSSISSQIDDAAAQVPEWAQGVDESGDIIS